MPNTQDELDLIERFITAYNAIDAHFQNLMGNGNSSSFRSLVDLYAKRHRNWKEGELLRTCAGLRNLLVHEKVEPVADPCVPVPQLVKKLEGARDRLLHPQRAIPRFERKVVTVRTDDSLAHVLKLIHELQFTHFPVYEYSRNGKKFAGVLTENGITRWLAEHTVEEQSLVELRDEPVTEVLAREESAKGKRRNFEFTARRTPVDAAVVRFQENMYLEAVLVTASGNPRDELLGIITRWDVLNLEL